MNTKKKKGYNKTFDEFRQEVIEKFGDICEFVDIEPDTFSYSYKKYHFRCKIHGKVKYTTPKILIQHSKWLCEDCYYENRIRKKYKKSKNEFRNTTPLWLVNKLKEFPNISFNENDILNIKTECLYHNVDRNVEFELTCAEHGVFKTTLNKLINKWRNDTNRNPCNSCTKHTSVEILAKQKNEMMNERFFKEVKDVHGDFYNYDKTDILNRRGVNSKITITCPIHGDFKMDASVHLRGEGCPQCKAEKRYISQQRIYRLIKTKYPYLTVILERSQPWLSAKQRYDIYIVELNMAVEYNGLEHFVPESYFNQIHSKRENVSIDEVFRHKRELDIQKYNDSMKNETFILYFTFLKEKYEYFDKVYNDLKDLYDLIEQRMGFVSYIPPL